MLTRRALAWHAAAAALAGIASGFYGLYSQHEQWLLDIEQVEEQRRHHACVAAKDDTTLAAARIDDKYFRLDPLDCPMKGQASFATLELTRKHGVESMFAYPQRNFRSDWGHAAGVAVFNSLLLLLVTLPLHLLVKGLARIGLAFLRGAGMAAGALWRRM